MGRLSAVGHGLGLPEQPAHSAHLTAMQADFSGFGRSEVLRTPSQKARFGSGSLQNLQMSFSRGKGWGFAVGLLPQAMQGYQSSANFMVPERFRYTEKAEGLLSLAYMQGAVRWYALALGYQVGYLWGTYERQRALQSPAQLIPDFLTSSFRLSGLQHRLGVLWQDSVGGRTAYQISLMYAFAAPLHRMLTYNFQKNFSLTDFLSDTLVQVETRFIYPAAWRGGIWLSTARWRLGIEGGWSSPAPAWEGKGLVLASGQSAWDIRIGNEWQPDARSSIFYKRMRYQFGGYIAQPPYAKIRAHGVTAGIGWQVPRSPHLIFLALEYGYLPHSQVRETFWQISVAAVFRELWFIPPRIE